MKRSKDTFMEHREAEIEHEKWCEAEYRNKCSDNWIEPIPYPWRNDKPKKAESVREKVDNPVAEHDISEHQIVAENQKHFEEDNPRE